MTGLIIAVHVIACVSLIVIVLVQRGKGGGLVESFSGLENMMGGKSSDFLKKSTTVFSIIFFCTCILLTVLSVRKSKSLLKNVPAQAAPVASKKPAASAPAATPPETPAVKPSNEAGALPKEALPSAVEEKKEAVGQKQSSEQQK